MCKSLNPWRCYADLSNNNARYPAYKNDNLGLFLCLIWHVNTCVTKLPFFAFKKIPVQIPTIHALYMLNFTQNTHLFPIWEDWPKSLWSCPLNYQLFWRRKLMSDVVEYRPVVIVWWYIHSCLRYERISICQDWTKNPETFLSDDWWPLSLS